MRDRNSIYRLHQDKGTLWWQNLELHKGTLWWQKAKLHNSCRSGSQVILRYVTGPETFSILAPIPCLWKKIIMSTLFLKINMNDTPLVITFEWQPSVYDTCRVSKGTQVLLGQYSLLTPQLLKLSHSIRTIAI